MYVDIHGTEIYYLEKGSGEPVILIHGMSDNSNIWLPFIPYLSTNYKVLALDLEGHGRSTNPLIEYSLEMFTGDLLNFIEHHGMEKVNLIGHSLGAVIAQDFASKNPHRVNKLILLAPFSHVDNVLENALIRLKKALKSSYFEFFDEAVNLVNTPEFIQENKEPIETLKIESQKINPPEILERVIDACLNVNINGELGNISQKTLIIGGDEDKMIQLSQFQYIHEKINNSKLVVMNGVGHNLFTMEKQDTIINLILEFLEE